MHKKKIVSIVLHLKCGHVWQIPRFTQSQCPALASANMAADLFLVTNAAGVISISPGALRSGIESSFSSPLLPFSPFALIS